MSVFRIFWLASAVAFSAIALAARVWPQALWALVVVVPLFLIGVRDVTQRQQGVRRNFPVIGNLRYLFESIRPEIQQYFVESDVNGLPFSRELRSVVYQRAKDVRDTRPFGTIRDLYDDGAEWIAHSLAPLAPPETPPRIPIGEGRCSQPYTASILNISAMSFGSLSSRAIRALNGGAERGGFYHNTGEGGVSPYHVEPGGDLVWQIGTGYFGCRTPDGNFDADTFTDRSRLPSVKMIEIKLSQGAKPGHGGILPGPKVTAEIAEIRGVPMGGDVLSPPYHRAFSTPLEFVEFIARLRELSGGKPVGFKLCVGRIDQFIGIVKAMLATGEGPDFITVDGSEGGTGAAPLEFSNSVGVPLTEGLLIVHNCLVGAGLRKSVKVIAAGKIVSGFNVIQRIAIGADLCNVARSMMMALGCIQALKCNTNHCPVGVATQDPDLARGLDVGDKERRVYNFHRNTVHAALELIGAAGLGHPDALRPSHIVRRVDVTEIRTYEEIYHYIDEGSLLDGGIAGVDSPVAELFAGAWERASADSF